MAIRFDKSVAGCYISCLDEWILSTVETWFVSRPVGELAPLDRGDRNQFDYFPLLRHFANLRLLEPRVPPRQTPREQLLHQAALDDLHLVDDRLGLLDGVVHRGKNGGDLVLLRNRMYQYLQALQNVEIYVAETSGALDTLPDVILDCP